MKKGKKFIAMILASAIVVTSIGVNPISVNAQANKCDVTVNENEQISDIVQENDISNDSYYEVVDDLETLRDNCVNLDCIQDVQKIGDDMVYTASFDGIITDKVSVEVTDNNSTVFNITENNIVQTVEITANGDYYVDGNYINLDEMISTKVVYSNLTTDATIAPSSQGTFRTSDCPYGKASDYKKLYSTTTTNIKKPTSTDKMTALGYALLLGGLLPLVGTVYTVVTGIVDAYSEDLPYLSIKTYRYVHSKKGYKVNSSLAVYKDISYYYNSKDASGTAATKETTYTYTVYM